MSMHICRKCKKEFFNPCPTPNALADFCIDCLDEAVKEGNLQEMVEGTS